AVLLASACGDGGAGSNPAPLQFGPLGNRSDLPVDDRIHVEHLQAPVDVVRDVYGRPHLYASSIADAFRVEGYLLAPDRTVQLRLLRRLAEGRLAELFAKLDKSVIDLDIAQRHIGLARVAKAEYEAMPAAARAPLEAYADGLTQLFGELRAGKRPLPKGVTN